MKKVLIGIGIVVAFFLVLWLGDETEEYRLYKIEAVVENVQNDVITFEREDGHKYSLIEKNNDYKIGEEVTIVFDNQNTHDTKDDTIKKVVR